MKRLVILCVAVAGLIVAAPTDAGCGKFRLPNPVRALKQKREHNHQASQPAAATLGIVTVWAGPANTTAQAQPAAGSSCANGNCFRRKR